jgi:HSP20 family molecular chaperone IbpA
MDPFLQQLLAYQQALKQQRRAPPAPPAYSTYYNNNDANSIFDDNEDAYVEDNEEPDQPQQNYGRYFDTSNNNDRDYPSRTGPFIRPTRAFTPHYFRFADSSHHPSYAYFDDNDEYAYQPPHQPPISKSNKPDIQKFRTSRPVNNVDDEEEIETGTDTNDEPQLTNNLDYPFISNIPEYNKYGRFGNNIRPSFFQFDRSQKPKAKAFNHESIDQSSPPFFFGSNNKRQRQQPKKSYPMYIMDRYGNLYPYESTQSKEQSKSNKKEIDANDLIRMLLGNGTGSTNDNNTLTEGQKADEEAKENELKNVISKAIEDELEQEAKEQIEKEENEEAKQESENKPKVPIAKANEETPLTREGLAEILAQLANEEQQPEAKENIEAVKETSNAPPLFRRQSTVPSLNVHKSEKKEVDETAPIKPIVVDDVKVSAPQLTKKNKPFSPALNVYEFKTKYIVVISLPGVSKDFVDIDYHPTTNELIIKGEANNKYLSEDDEANSFILKVSEQRFGNFERIVKIPAYPGIDDSQIKAKFLNGMLEIKLPKIDESKLPKIPKKITLEDIPDEELQRESSSGLI